MNANSKSGPRAKVTKVCSTSEGAITNQQFRHAPDFDFACVSQRWQNGGRHPLGLAGLSCSFNDYASQGLSCLANFR
jgi:hypothetical protein